MFSSGMQRGDSKLLCGGMVKIMAGSGVDGKQVCTNTKERGKYIWFGEETVIKIIQRAGHYFTTHFPLGYAHLCTN